MPELPHCTWAPVLGHQEPTSPTAQRCHSCPTRTSQICWKSEPDTDGNLRNLAVNVPTKPQGSETGTAEHGCLARAPRVAVWQREAGRRAQVVSLCAQAGKLTALLLPPERLGYSLIEQCFYFYLSCFFFVSQAGFELAS